MSSCTNSDPSGRILGLDIGDRRVGVAVSDELQMVASPVEVVTRDDHIFERLAHLAGEHDAILVVAGLPTSMSGKEGKQAESSRYFAEAVSAKIKLPLEYWDERLSSALAERLMIESGTRREARKSRIDAVAASLILQGYLDSLRYGRRGFR